MAAGFVYWIAEDKLQRLSEAFQLFKNHNGWKGEIACVFIVGNVLGESDCDGISYIVSSSVSSKMVLKPLAPAFLNIASSAILIRASGKN